MKRASCLVTALLLLALAFAGAASAQTQTGTVLGRVMDQQGAVLPGVTVTLTGPRGVQTAVSDAEGNYRFVGVQPATYTLKAELAGFTPQQEDRVIVTMGRTLTLDFSLKVGGLTETVEVTGTASTVDVKSSATTTNVSGDLLSSIALYDSTATGLMNAAPGINDESAFGGQDYYGNALLLDGVDTRDPEGGSAWTFFNQNLIEDIQIGGLGVPAEYGGFSGAVVNTITKSGGNTFSGLFSMRYTRGAWAATNVTDEIIDQNPSLGEGGDVLRKLTDYTVQMGGPFKKARAICFASIQRYSTDAVPSAPLNKRTEISPRFNAKLTLQPTSSDTIILGGQYDQYNVDGRVGWWSSAQTIYDATVKEDAPEWVWNAQYRRVFGSSSLLEAKFTGYSGYYYLDPVNPDPPSFDGGTGEYGGGGGGIYYADRGRNQVNVSFTRYAQKFGSHSLKFGAEIERSRARSQSQPYGPAGFYIYSYYGVPYGQYSYSYDLPARNKRMSAFAQDQWSVGRLTMNLGVRLDHIRGSGDNIDYDVYKPKASWGPRLGAAYDLTGKGNTVLKGFWGRYFEGGSAGFFEYSLPPGVSDFSVRPYNEDGTLSDTVEVLTPGFLYGMASNVRHPSTDEFNLSFEQQITRTLRFTVTGIYRTWGNFINNVVPGAIWSPVTFRNDLTGQDFTGYYWVNREDTATSVMTQNIKGYKFMAADGSTIATADPERNYKGLMFVLSRSLRSNFGFQASYVLSKSEGNMDNSGWGDWLGGTRWMSPNQAIVNNRGELSNSRTHEIKIHTSYKVPYVDVMLGLSYTGMSGYPYTPYAQFGEGDLNVIGSSRRRIYLKERGSDRNDFYHVLDLRAEKVFNVSGQRFGVYADFNNLTNRAGVISRNTRYPYTTIGGEQVLYGWPTEIQTPRQVTLGARWSF